MPIYEYRCQACGHKSSFFVRSINSPLAAVCSFCHSREMTRVLSAFARRRTVKGVHEASGPPPEEGGRWEDYYKDPRNIGRWVEQKFSDWNMDMPSQLRDRIDAAREGELPKELDA